MSFRATVESMSKIMDEMGITELDLERQFLFGLYRKHIHLSKQQSAVAPVLSSEFRVQNSEVKTTQNPEIRTQNSVKSPMVGVVYLSPDPDSEPFISVGKSINVGDTVCLIEAMKTFNPVVSDKAGIVREILVKDGTAVEYDQPLIVIE